MTRHLIISVLLLLFSPLVHGQAKGLAIWKESRSHPTVHLFEYTLVQNQGAVTNFRTLQGRKFELTKYQILAVIPYSSLPATIIDSKQVAGLETNIRYYEDVIKTYPTTTNYFRPYLSVAADMREQIKEGKVRINRVWMTREDYQKRITAKEEAAKKATAERLAQRRAFENRHRKR